jgi:hypothetical protein
MLVDGLQLNAQGFVDLGISEIYDNQELLRQLSNDKEVPLPS